MLRVFQRRNAPRVGTEFKLESCKHGMPSREKAMQILSVALRNFKIHRDRYFEFQPGTNAICGENGAGKTSILEGIAWVLFNHHGDYAKEDLICNGKGSAQVTVAFVSNYDSRSYEVQRCTQKGYAIYDPQLDQRLPYSRIKDEVLPWLRQHLGVSATTNLPQLFARTIGVPQGTFTADFLQPAEHRKSVFDAILKVEDYKLAFKQMNALRRYAEGQVNTLKSQIDQYEESLAPWDDLQTRRQTLQQDLQASQHRLTQLSQQLEQLQAQRQQVKAQAQQVQTLTSQHQGLSHQVAAQQQMVATLQQAVQQAQQAVAICQTHHGDYAAYQAADQALQQLGQQQQQRQQLQDRYRQQQIIHSQQQADLARLQTQLEAFAKTEQDLAQLAPQVEQQAQWETQQQQLQCTMEQLQQQQLQRQQLQTQDQQLAQRLTELEESIQQLTALQEPVAEIATLEDQRDRSQQQLSRIAAARQFEAEMRQLVNRSQAQRTTHQQQVEAMFQELAALAESIPLVSAETMSRLTTVLQAGTDLHGSLVEQLEHILQDLANQTDEAALNTSLHTLQKALKERYRWRGELAQIPALERQRADLAQQQNSLNQQLASLEHTLSKQPQVAAELAAIAQHIDDLGHPREKSQILQRTLQDKPKVEQAHKRLHQTHTEQAASLAALATELDQLQTVDALINQQQQQRQQHQSGYSLYLQNQQLAQQHPQLQTDLDKTETELSQLQAQWQAIAQSLAEAQAEFDPAAAETLETTYSTLKSEADQLAGSVPQQQQLIASVDQQIANLQAIAKQRDAAQAQLKTKERNKRFINFARKAYKDAGPRITEQYVRSISQQADRLFRELLDRPNVALEWSRDYDIVVQDGPNQRRFVNLSGGEQMCAALAVRLALLKVLADVDIAFFDEPTTNMDRLRRQGLAEAISRIKTFQQLFVISHDDTFEQVTENVIMVTRETD
jgi:exonuclease SbcC